MRGVTENTAGVIMSRTVVRSMAGTRAARSRSRSWMRMSARLTTPIGRPDSSITGAALKPFSVSQATASGTVASAPMDIGLGVIRSAARAASRVKRDARGIVGVLAIGHLVGSEMWRGTGNRSLERIIAGGSPVGKSKVGDMGPLQLFVEMIAALLHWFGLCSDLRIVNRSFAIFYPIEDFRPRDGFYTLELKGVTSMHRRTFGLLALLTLISACVALG